MYFITTKRMLEVCFSVHPNIQYRTFFCLGGFYLIFRAYSNPNSFFRPAGGAATASLRYPYIWLMASDST